LSVREAVLLGLLTAAVLIAIRFAFVWPLLALVRRRESPERARTMAGRRRRRAIRRRPRRPAVEADAERNRRRARLLIERRRNDLAQLQAEGLGWRGGVVLGWAGMRGVVTLAAAQSLPRDVPYYEQLVLIAFTVAITTLLLQGSTLPFVIRASGVRGTDRAADRRRLAELLDEMQTAGLAAIERPAFELPDGRAVDDEILDRVRRDTTLAAEAAWERAEHADTELGILESPHRQYRVLRQEVLQAERTVLL